jgi:hypothetical protein
MNLNRLGSGRKLIQQIADQGLVKKYAMDTPAAKRCYQPA